MAIIFLPVLLVAPLRACAAVSMHSQQALASSLVQRTALAGQEPGSAEVLQSEIDSLGFIHEPDSMWLERKQVHLDQMRKEAAHRHDCDSCSRGAEWFQIHYEPSFHCELEQRVGMMGDGGKWVCDLSAIARRVESGDRCLVYSVGSNGDFSFEEAVLNQISPMCEVHTFDPMAAGVWTPPANVTYHSIALGQELPAKTLSQIVQELGHSGRKIDLFKIDCEGCEWDTYQAWLGSGVDIRQILVEMHWRQNPQAAHEMFEFLRKHGYVVFNKEPNTLGCGGECIEYAFLKMKPEFSSSI